MGHDAASQMQTPLSQVCPAPQLPAKHTPPHPSLPPQTAPVQSGTHTQLPPLQLDPWEQATHAEPPAPHALGSVPLAHTPPPQQPEHDVKSHSHTPAMQ